MDFSTYDLTQLRLAPEGVFGLADGLLREMADQFGYDLSGHTEEDLRELIGAIGPAKALQDNIHHVEQVLGSNAVDIAAGWLERSGVMNALSGAFWQPSNPVPSSVDVVIWSGGVANWQLRRRDLTERLAPKAIRRVVLPMGTRKMGPSEHQLVATYIDEYGQQPTEAEFGLRYVIPVLMQAGLEATVFPVNSGKGNDVCQAVFRTYPTFLKGTVLTVGNAPNTLQGAGQLRDAARAMDPTFDHDGDQMFMMGDFFPVARHGESKDTHQNPLSGISQIARVALYLCKATTV